MDAIPPNDKPRRLRSRKRKYADIEASEGAQTRSPAIIDPKTNPAISKTQTPATGDADYNDKEERQRKEKRKAKNRKMSWKVSEPVGGLLSDLLPIFSNDENHLLLGYSHSVKVYSAATSMLVRVCQTGNTELSSFCVSKQFPTHLYILLGDGKIQLWDWTIGQRLKTWDLGGHVSDVTVSALNPSSTDAMDTVFIAESRKGSSEITAHRLLGNDGKAAKSLYRTKQSIRKVRTLNHGHFIVAITPSSLVVGTRLNTATNKLKQLHYSFNTFAIPDAITCFDARIRSGEQSQQSANDSVDIAVGLQDGSIRIYYDAGQLPESKTRQSHLTPKNEKLHWHRKAVRSIAWAVDGNYLLSGGSETVLVLWQLDTNSKTMLPHLMSSIEAITVSAQGSSYAVRLADNSAMILATTDLVPTFNAVGHGIPSTRPYHEDFLATTLPHRRTPITCSVTQPPRLLCAVPSDPYRGEMKDDTYIGFHTNTSLSSIPLSSMTTSVSRQALVDSHATDVRIAPTGKPITNSNVVLLEVSHDGKWLATVDEWFQPLDDILSLSIDKDAAKIQQLSGVETSIVFWRWNEIRNVWEKSTRISAPHSDEIYPSKNASLVLDLVAELQQTAFWTLGSDGRIKQWQLRNREVVSTRVTATAGGPDHVWKCTKSIVVPHDSTAVTDSTSPILSARLSVSNDGSMFAASRTASLDSEITLFSIQQDGTAKNLLNFKLEYPGVSGAFLNQYFILADCNSVLVKDLTDSTKWYRAAFGSSAAPSDLMIPPQIAVDPEHLVFAISVPRKRKSEESGRSRKSRISIFSPLSSSPLATLDNQPLSASLLCVPQQRKFHILTTGAEMYTISPDLLQSDGEISNLNVKDAGGERSEQEPMRTSNLLDNVFGSNPSDTVRSSEEVLLGIETTPQRIIAWDEIPGVNLEQPFTLPKMSAIQAMMSTTAARG